MARSFDGATQFLASAAGQTLQYSPSSMMIDFIPFNAPAVLFGGLSTTHVTWDGNYFSVDAGPVMNVNTTSNSTFGSASKLATTLGVRSILTATWFSSAARQVFSNNQAGNLDTSSITPVFSGTNAIAFACSHRSTNDGFANAIIYRAFVWNTALTFQDHLAIVNGVSPERIYPEKLLDGWYFDGVGGNGSTEPGILRKLFLAPTANPGVVPVVRNIIAPKTMRRGAFIVPSTIFRKSASRIGTRTGTRQTWAA